MKAHHTPSYPLLKIKTQNACILTSALYNAPHCRNLTTVCEPMRLEGEALKPHKCILRLSSQSL